MPSKEEWERINAARQGYIAKRNRENEQITTLSEEQHEVIQDLCRIRHEIHSSWEGMFNAESADYDKWKDLDSIIEKLNEAKLPNLKIYFDTISSTEDWLYMLSDEEKAVYEQRAEEDPRDITDYQLWCEETYSSFCEDMEYINTEIENYLKEIDDEHGTHYCPTGVQRNFDIISHHKEENTMPDIEKETLGSTPDEEQVTVPEEDTDFIFSVHQYDTHAQYMNTQFTLAQLIEAAQSEKPFMALRDMGEKPIDSFTVATIEQSDKPFMSVDFDLDNDTVRIMNNDIIKNYQISTVSVDEIAKDFYSEPNSQSLNAVDTFRDNVTLNVACSLAVQTGMSMIKEQFNSLELLDKVVSEFGLDRVSAVVASEIKHRMSEMPLNTNNLMNWAQGVVDKLPMQLVNELSLNIDKEQLIDFAYTVMKAEIARDNVQENDTMAELFAQLQKNQHITDNALNPEILNDRRAVEEIKLQSSLAHAKSAFEQQSNTLPILKGLSEIQINKLNNLNAKQTELNNKNKFLVNKGQRLEARAEKLENISTMLKALFPNRQLPKPLQALADMTAKKAAVIRDEKIPKNNLKIDKNLRRMAKNDRKIEVAQCKVDKYQNMSKVIKSFTVLDSTERKQQFTQGLDGLHNASQRSLQLKLEKCEAKIDKLTQKYMDIETPNKPDIMAKLKAQTEKKNTLSEKIEKLGKLEKPFAEQPENVVDDVMKTAETEIEVQEEAPERMSMEDFADELCTACVDTAVVPTVEKEKTVSISKDEYDKLDLSHKGTLLAEYKYDFSDHDQSWTDSSHIYQLNDRYFSDFTSGYDGKGTFEELTADQMKSKLSDFAEKSGKDKDYSVTEAGEKLLDGKTAEKDKSADKKPSVLGDIKDIKSEQSKAQKNVPEQGHKMARSNEAEI